VEGEPLEEPMEGVGATGGEILTEPVSSNVLHFMFIRKWRHGASRVVFRESLIKKHKVREPAANSDGWFLECGEVGLMMGQFVGESK
jgi:hypothetical protein